MLFIFVALSLEVRPDGRAYGLGDVGEAGAGVVVCRASVRVLSHCRSRNRGTDYIGESGMKWMSISSLALSDNAVEPG